MFDTYLLIRSKSNYSLLKNILDVMGTRRAYIWKGKLRNCSIYTTRKLSLCLVCRAAQEAFYNLSVVAVQHYET